MAPRMRRTLYIKDDDYRYSFLFGHFVTLTNLSEHDWNRLIEQHLSPLYVSVHATDLELRRQCLRNPTAPDIMAQLRELSEHNFEVHTQLVITPGVNDGEAMERSIRDLATLWPTVQSISVVPVGLTNHHKYGLRTVSRAEATATLDTCERLQGEFRAKFGVGFVYPTDEWFLIDGRTLPPLDWYDGLALHENGLGMVRSFLDEWNQVRAHELANLQPRVRSVTLVTATLFGPVLEKAAAELAAQTGLNVQVRAIKNTKLGEGITVAGLLMGEDVITQLQDSGDPGDLIVLPRIMFDHPDGISLDDKSPLTIAEALNRPVVLADQMGDVIDALQGKNALTFQPGLLNPSEPVVRDGGWAVEKYL
jgi:putative radical SAM enzyme (TIGR03279 family)